MINYNIEYQENFSRSQLLLRTFFGTFYIFIPHFFLLMFIQIASGVLSFLAWWSVLFTERYPRSIFDFQLNNMRWVARVQARMFHLIDGYPAFGMKKTDPGITFDIAYPESLSRWLLLLRTFFGLFYCLIPHSFLFFFRMIGSIFLIFLSWWAVLFTGKYPHSWHKFTVDTLRWEMRVNIYMMFMSDSYPPFNGKP